MIGGTVFYTEAIFYDFYWSNGSFLVGYLIVDYFTVASLTETYLIGIYLTDNSFSDYLRIYLAYSICSIALASGFFYIYLWTSFF